MRRGRIKTWDVEDRSKTHRTVSQKLVGPFLGMMAAREIEMKALLHGTDQF